MKIICIGRNYLDHVKELSNEVPEEPVIFIKPDSAVLRNNQPFYIPDFSSDVHYETELFVRIHKLGKSIPESFAGDYYSEIGLGIDFTARDIQSKLKAKGLPWEKAKAFDHSAVIGMSFPKEGLNPENLEFGLKVNGEWRQRGNSNCMMLNMNQIISHVSKYFKLKVGDLIFTGTPAGVGPVKSGDRLQGYFQDILAFDFEIK